jgi:hypothetical protein
MIVKYITNDRYTGMPSVVKKNTDATSEIHEAWLDTYTSIGKTI